MSETNKDYFTEMVKLLSLMGGGAIVIVIAVIWLNSLINAESPVDPMQQALTNDRLKANEVVIVKGAKIPAGQAKTASGPAVVKKMAVAASLDGKAIATTSCSACHATGILAAPKIADKAAWQLRLDTNGGMDGLVKSAIVGKGSMPAKGGAMNLSDAEIKAAIEYMIQ